MTKLRVAIFFLALSSLPVFASAQEGITGGEVHPACIAETKRRAAMKPPQPPPMGDFPCTVPITGVGGSVAGMCFAIKCKGMSSPGLDGGQQGLGKLEGIVSQLMQGIMSKLMGGGGGGGGESGGGQGGQTGLDSKLGQLPSCSIYSGVISSTASSTSVRLSWNSTDATSAAISPGIGSVTPSGSQEVTVLSTATYVLSVTGPAGQNVCSTTVIGPGGAGGAGSNLSDLLNSFTGTTNTGTTTSTNNNNTNVTSVLDQIFSTTNPGTFTATTTRTGSTTVLTTGVQTGQTVISPFGASGDIRIFEQGATIIAGMRDPGSNTQIAGFYGGNSSGTFKSTGVVGQLCASRPWATNVFSKIITPTFFDSLCTWRGYQVGTPLPAQQTPSRNTGSQTTPVKTATTTKATTTVPTVPAKADVWAVPASVPLGARTSIFWNTQGVVSCTVSSPDGSFNQSSLSGGAATVPLSGATTFTISCLDVAGNPVTDYVTVNLAI